LHEDAVPITVVWFALPTSIKYIECDCEKKTRFKRHIISCVINIQHTYQKAKDDKTMVAPSTVPQDADAPLGIRTKPLVEPEAQMAVSSAGKLVVSNIKTKEVEHEQETAESREPAYADVIDLTDTVQIESMPQEARDGSSWLPACFGCAPAANEVANEEMSREQPEVEAREESPEPTSATEMENEGATSPKTEDIAKESETTKPQPGLWKWLTELVDPVPEVLSPVAAVDPAAPVDRDVSDDPTEAIEALETVEPVVPVVPVAPVDPVVTGFCGMFSSIEAVSEKEKEEDQDASISGDSGNLLGDLLSLPDIKEDVTISGATMKTDDLDCREDGSVARERSIVQFTTSKAKETGAMAVISEHDEEPIKGLDRSKETRRLLLMKDLRTAISTHGRYDVRVADISAALGDLLNESAEHEQALKLHRDATAIYSAKKGDADPTTIDAKNRLGQILEEAGHFDEAINTYYGVMVMQRALKGEQDTSAGDSLVNMANALRRKGDYTQGIKELKRALKIYRESLGDSHEKVSITVDAIASLYVTLGDFEKSAAILEEVVKLKAATMGMKSDAVAVTMISLATTYECSEEFDKAMKSLKKAYKIYTEIEGYSSDNSTSTLNRIAQLYEAMNDHNRASIAYLGVLRGCKINLGKDHLHVGEMYYKLGHSLRLTGQLEKALKCLKEALPIYVAKGVEMSDVEMIAQVMHEMALIYQEKQDYKEAARVLNQELSVRQKIGQPEFPLIARTLNHLGMVEFEMENNSRALKHLVEALTIYQTRGEHGVDCAEVLFNAGLVFEAVENYERAQDAFAESARIYEERGFKEDHHFILMANEKLAQVSELNN
jgi:tetratricopeptide (TPR) repeat protein